MEACLEEEEEMAVIMTEDGGQIDVPLALLMQTSPVLRRMHLAGDTDAGGRLSVVADASTLLAVLDLMRCGEPEAAVSQMPGGVSPVKVASLANRLRVHGRRWEAVACKYRALVAPLDG